MEVGDRGPEVVVPNPARGRMVAVLRDLIRVVGDLDPEHLVDVLDREQKRRIADSSRGEPAAERSDRPIQLNVFTMPGILEFLRVLGLTGDVTRAAKVSGFGRDVLYLERGRSRWFREAWEAAARRGLRSLKEEHERRRLDRDE